jgi:HEPN domain-containing protein
MGHSVDGLLAALEAEGPEASELLDGAKELDQHYVPTRYPNGLPANVPFQAYTTAQARRALGHARAITAFARNRIAR